jgi:hypothetical protein
VPSICVCPRCGKEMWCGPEPDQVCAVCKRVPEPEQPRFVEMLGFTVDPSVPDVFGWMPADGWSKERRSCG